MQLTFFKNYYLVRFDGTNSPILAVKTVELCLVRGTSYCKILLVQRSIERNSLQRQLKLNSVSGSFADQAESNTESVVFLFPTHISGLKP